MEIKHLEVEDFEIDYYYVRETDKWIFEVYRGLADTCRLTHWCGEDELNTEDILKLAQDLY